MQCLFQQIIGHIVVSMNNLDIDYAEYIKLGISIELFIYIRAIDVYITRTDNLK